MTLSATAAQLGIPTYEDALIELAGSDHRVVVLTAENRAAIRGVPQALGDRFIDVGIAEQTLIGAAAGLALSGRIPVVHGLAAFLTMRAFEFCRTDVALHDLPVKLVGFIPGLASDGNGPTHQAIEDVGLMRLIPGMRVFCPADVADLVAALPAIIADPHPWYVRYCDAPAPVGHGPLTSATAEVLLEGNDVGLITYGLAVTPTLEAAHLLAESGIGARVVAMRTVEPVDIEALDAALRLPLCVTVEDHLTRGGLASIVAERALATRTVPEHLAIGLETWFTPATRSHVLSAEGFTGPRIAERVLARWKEKA